MSETWPFGVRTGPHATNSSKQVSAPASLRRLSPSRRPATPALHSIASVNSVNSAHYSSTLPLAHQIHDASPSKTELLAIINELQRERGSLRGQAQEMRDALLHSQELISQMEQRRPERRQQPPTPLLRSSTSTTHHSPSKRTQGSSLSENPWVQSLFEGDKQRSSPPRNSSVVGRSGGSGGGAGWEQKLAAAVAERAGLQREEEELEACPASDVVAQSRLGTVKGLIAKKDELVARLETLLTESRYNADGRNVRSQDTQTDLDRSIFFEHIPATLGSLYAFYPPAMDTPINIGTEHAADVCLDMTPSMVMHLQRQVSELTVKCTQLTCELAMTRRGGQGSGVQQSTAPQKRLSQVSISSQHQVVPVDNRSSVPSGGGGGGGGGGVPVQHSSVVQSMPSGGSHHGSQSGVSSGGGGGGGSGVPEPSRSETPQAAPGPPQPAAHPSNPQSQQSQQSQPQRPASLSGSQRSGQGGGGGGGGGGVPASSIATPSNAASAAPSQDVQMCKIGFVGESHPPKGKAPGVVLVWIFFGGGLRCGEGSCCWERERGGEGRGSWGWGGNL